MVKIIVTAPKGKMGRLIVHEAIINKDIELIGCIGPENREYIGKDAGLVSGFGSETGALIYDNIETIIDECDVVVDFSRVDTSMKILRACKKHNKALVCGTTGFDEVQDKEISDASKEIPIMKTANTSFMVNTMVEMMNIAAKTLGNKCKIEILDMHDEKKVDAPSGTAIEFAEEMSKASSVPVDKMDFHSIRAGDISSSHTIYFGGMGERIELTHHAYNWKCYAVGAVEAVKFISKKAAGFYSMKEVIKE